MAQPELAAEVEEDAYRKKVLETFIRRGRLTQIPAQHKKWQIILEKLAAELSRIERTLSVRSTRS